MDGREDQERSAGAKRAPAFWRMVRRTPRPPRATAARRLRAGAAVLLLTLAAVIIGVLLGGRVYTEVGPFRAQVSVTPTLTGGTTVSVPPLGALQLDTHDGPAHLSLQLGALDQARVESLLHNPDAINYLSRTAVTDVTNAVIRVGLRTIAVAVLAALVLSALVFRDVRRVAWSGGLALVIAAGSVGVAGATARPSALDEPRYEGLLVNAPAIVGDARRIANDYGRYAAQLERLVGNVSKLYTTISALPVYEPAPGTTRVLHISDMHLNPAAWQLIRTVVEQFNIDVIIDTGDMTDWGSEPETSFVASIALLKKPYIFIRGNHDSAATAAAVDRQPNTTVLNNSVTTVAGLTIAGIGDPRFTPDKSTAPAAGGLDQPTAEQVIGAGEQLATTIRQSPRPANIALVHDPASAGPLSGLVPLVLAGHVHERRAVRLPEVSPDHPTQLLVQGSTGGAGLRGLEGEKPTPLTMSILYFDQARLLQAYDDISVGGTGESQVNLVRHIVPDPARGDQKVPVTPTPTR
ncbi:MAG TPA: metallophosphoesterase [Micromonosporaceae bacterium]